MPIIVVITKILVFLIIIGYVFLNLTNDEVSRNFIAIVISGGFIYIIILDVIFLVSLVINLGIREKNKKLNGAEK
ncbi:hypothetical protein [Leptotrichia sp. oral taxon 223]|uniref:hypothetical protein n=1 Tax=Leptotrichia sp. oral taxon 223 TaxID=712363 RepID=UPI0015B7AAC2|nr:hypothetical protein [Leptotrichia sp. oral taxon 223]NWO18516.1 hypothetical protein [Leptotrichia sp. oral taxon 223]